MLTKEKIHHMVALALAEDLGEGDITSTAVIPKGSQAEAVMIAKATGIVCGLEVAREVFRQVDKKVVFTPLVADGKRVKPGVRIARIKGLTRSVLAGERLALNFMSHLSGVATLTNEFVRQVKPHKVKILDTRKTTPGLRAFEKYAVCCGGGTNHRQGLWDWVLIKDNHLEAIYHGRKAGICPITEALSAARKQLGHSTTIIEIEVDNMHDFQLALDLAPDVIMLDNMTLTQIRAAVCARNKRYSKTQKSRPQLEVSGNVSLRRVKALAATGVDLISIGALTHSVSSLDFSLDILSV